MLQRTFLFVSVLSLGLASVAAQSLPLELHLPTDNAALFDGRLPDYFQFVDRDFEGTKSTPWEGGQFGFVRDPRRLGSRIAYARFHEGMDVKPLRRDAKGDPLDEVRAIADGEVVYVTGKDARSNYGRYLVVRHNWGHGPFFSLYAHLREARVAAGQKVSGGQAIALMGYTGSGIDQRRAHVHVELNLMLSSQFEDWHAKHFTTPNHHGIFNGMNLIGLDLQALFLAWRKTPALSVVEFIAGSEPFYEVTLPTHARMEILSRYPWLAAGAAPATGKPENWAVRFTRWGLPVSAKPAATLVAIPAVTWIKPDPVPHYYNTRGIVTGSGATGKLTVDGLRFIQLMCGLEL